MFRYFLLVALFSFVIKPCCHAFDLSGSGGVQMRFFPHAPLYEGQFDEPGFSISIEPEVHHDWSEGQQSMTFTPFCRLDQHDSNRTHCDIRQLYWQLLQERWEARIGFQQVFWGVTESLHLVDVINQIDFVEDFNLESKLGQPMIDLSLISKLGTWQLYLMPYFRERTFPGKEGRLRTAIPVDTDNARYESEDEEHHLDWAIRWSNTIDEFDIGLAFFRGTNRDPFLIPNVDPSGRVTLEPFYNLIEQTSLDLQWTHKNWLWKLELLHRESTDDGFWASVGGFEYTFVGVFNSAIDIGVLSEYLYDQRGLNTQTPFENDIYIGSRIVLNDVKMTEILLGTIYDLDTGENIIQVEASRRLWNNFRLNLEGLVINGKPPEGLLWELRADDVISISLDYYF